MLHTKSPALERSMVIIMNQFKTILKFELQGYFKNKIFVGVTFFLVAVIALIMFFPRIKPLFAGEKKETAKLPIMLIALDAESTSSTMDHGRESSQSMMEFFSSAFSDYDIRIAEGGLEDIKNQISSGEAKCAFVLHSLTSYTYYVENLSMYDNNTSIADNVLQSIYQINAMTQSGLSLNEAERILQIPVEHTTESLGKDQMQNFFYTYIMIFALYMVILLYGQMVATNVASEKSSRAMELLITSAKPASMMFGKVIASCIAGLLQLVCVFGSAFLFFNLNRGEWGGNQTINSIFNMPLDLLIYMLLFFILGFFMYAFMFGAIGSTASKLEDINTSVMPVTLVFIASFLVVIMSMTEGNVDSALMKVCSYLPFTSPMAMFTRIAMSTVPFYQVALSVAILIGSVIGVGILSAKIYRVGVLLYGTTPKIGAMLKSVWKA